MTMSGPLEEAYFNWLCAKVLSPGTRQQYRDLLWILHKTEFIVVVAADGNREKDGRELRQYFTTETGWPRESHWFSEPASVMEVFVAFAQRAHFQTEIPVSTWFWNFMTNLELGEYRRVTEGDIPYIEGVLQTLMNREYDYSGRGGMFPMRWPKRDQGGVEIWHQFCEYVEENGLI